MTSTSRVVVRNLERSVGPEELTTLLKELFGINAVYSELIPDRSTKKNSGEAIVECSSAEEAKSAVAASPKTYAGKPVIIEILRPFTVPSSQD